MGPILACGDTNAAVDNLVEGLVGQGLKVVRLGQAAKVRVGGKGWNTGCEDGRNRGSRQLGQKKHEQGHFHLSQQIRRETVKGGVTAWAESYIRPFK